MPACIMNIIRRPIPGNYREVLNGSIERIQTREVKEIRTYVTRSITTHRAGVDVTTVRLFNSFDEFEELLDGMDANDGAQKSFDELASKCRSVDFVVGEIMTPLRGHNSDLRYMTRNVFTAKPGKRTDLIETLMEIRDSHMDGRGAIMRPIGNFDNVRLTIPHKSMESVRASLAFIQSPENKDVYERISSLTTKMERFVSRIYYPQE